MFFASCARKPIISKKYNTREIKTMKKIIPLCLLFTLTTLKATKPQTFDPQVSIWDRIMYHQSQVNMFRGIVFMYQGLYNNAGAEFGKAVVKNPKSAKAHILLGASLYWQGQIEHAITEYKTALDLDDKNAQGYQLLAIAYAWKGEVKKALANFKTALEYAPDRADIYMDLGSVYHALGNKQQALRYFRKATDIAPKHPLYHYQLGLLYSRLEQNEDAITSFKEAVSLYKKYQDAILELGSVYEKTGDIDKALGYFKKASRLKPYDAVARLKFVNLLVKQKNYKQANEEIMNAFSLSPVSKNKSIALSLAYAGGRSNQPDDKNNQGETNQKDNFLENLEKNLKKLPLSENAEIDLKLVYLPKPRLEKKPKETAFKKALKEAFEGYDVKSANRTFRVPASDLQTRKQYIQAVIKEISELLGQIPQDCQTNMSLDIKTNVESDNSLQEKYPLSDKKVAYNPRNVGNDMGLWIIGTAWFDLVKEAMPEIIENTKNADGTHWLTAGLGHLILARPDEAIKCFLKAIELGYKESGYLGLSVAYIELGKEEKAKEYNQKVLKINPKNKTASQNLKWLDTPLDSEK